MSISEVNSLDHVPNYVDPSTRTAELLTIHITMIALASLVVALRLISRYLVVKNPGWDDYMIILAMVLGLMQAVLTLSCITHGAAMHFWDIKPSVHLAFTLMISYAVQVLYPLAVTAIKLSILFLYLRLFPSRSFRTFVVGHMVLAVVGGLVASAVTIFQCKPIAKNWIGALPGACLDQGRLFEVVVIFNLLTNVMILLLPMPTIWWLHMPLRRRILVLGIFSIGAIPCASLIGRLILWSNNRIAASKFRSDPTWFVVPAQDWAIVEICSGLICASLVPLKPLVKVGIPCLAEPSQGVLYAARPSRIRASVPAFEPGDMTKLQLDHRMYMTTSATCGGTSEDALEKGQGITVTKDVLIMESYPELQIPDKVLIQSTQSLQADGVSRTTG